MDREAWEYFEKNKRQAVNIALPEREESEPNITEKQIEELIADLFFISLLFLPIVLVLIFLVIIFS